MLKNKISLIEMEYSISKIFDIRKNLIIPNISWGLNMHECDLLILKNSNIGIEIEIKRSISDINADFKKKHAHNDMRISELYYALSEDIFEKGKDLIPENNGIIKCYRYNDEVYATIYRYAKKNKNYIKFTDEERKKLMRLGCMRIWNLKKKLIKYESI